MYPHFTSDISGKHFLAPDDFATIYDIHGLYNSGIDGSFEAIAVLGQTDLSTGFQPQQPVRCANIPQRG